MTKFTTKYCLYTRNLEKGCALLYILKVVEYLLNVPNVMVGEHSTLN